jgi:hypothetical protein
MKLRAAILAAFLSLWATPAFSQACSMCYSTAKATSKDGQRAISKGVVVLLLPPLGFMTLGVWVALRYGKKRDLEQARATVLSVKPNAVQFKSDPQPIFVEELPDLRRKPILVG